MAIDPNMLDSATTDEHAAREQKKAVLAFERACIRVSGDIDEEGWVVETGVKIVPKYPGERHDLKCGECQAPMRLRESKYGPFYGCSTYPKCKGSHGAHPDGAPLGVPTNKITQAARIKAHEAFDRLWKKGLTSREAAYVWLQRTMGMPATEAHIANFNIDQCQRVIDLAKKRYGELSRPSIWHRLMNDD